MKFMALGLAVLAFATVSVAEPAFKVGGKTKSVEQLYKDNEATFFKLEKEKYGIIEGMANQAYLDYYWQKEAKKAGKSVGEFQKSYFEKNTKVTAKEISSTLDQFKDHPQLKKLPKKDQESQVKEYLSQKKKQEVTDDIIAAGLKKGDLKILYKQPKEPTYNVTVKKDDNIRFGPSPDDIKPMGCNENCPITVVEYSEFQCPFCSKVLPSVKRLLTEYKGKVRWVVRDFPLSFHNRAKPAAFAAHCAAKQGKFWHMYNALFSNQRKLEDADLAGYAKNISGLKFDKWKSCYDKPGELASLIDENMGSGAKLGVSGTPAFFINGRRLSGALPYQQFKTIFDEEIQKMGKSE